MYLDEGAEAFNAHKERQVQERYSVSLKNVKDNRKFNEQFKNCDNCRTIITE